LEASAIDNSAGYLVHRFNVPRLPLVSLNPLDPRSWPKITRTHRAAQNCLQKLADSDRPDHILALWALPSGYWARQVGKHYGIPYSTWALGSDIWTLGKLPVLRQILAGVLHKADRIYADGVRLAHDVEMIGGRNCEFLPSARQLTDRPVPTRAPENGLRLGYLGRWHPNKGPDLLLEALALLPESAWQRIESVRIAGGGPLENDVKKLAQPLIDHGYPLQLEGYKNKTEALELLSWADYVLIPSRIESIPVIFSDAMQTGRPVITTPVGDLADLIKRYGAGICATSATASDFAASLRQALEINPLQFQTGITLAQSDFRIDAIADTLIQQLFTQNSGDANAPTRHDQMD
jgi:glycosyltransferase involved in cell wall biosynthesis